LAGYGSAVCFGMKYTMSTSTMTGKFRLRAPRVDTLGFAPTQEDLLAYFRGKYDHGGPVGASPLLRLRHEFISADDYYETLVAKLVKNGTRWIDVGCGRDVFPSNYAAAKELAARCPVFVGVDPDPNVHENDLLTDRFQGTIEEYSTPQKFDLVTLRMVAEHVVTPERTADKLAELAAPGGLVVIYTPWKWSPMSRVASIVPFSLHNKLKRLIWDSEPQDTFPTAYKMNTFGALKALFEARGFELAFFCDVDDCSVFTRYMGLNAVEIGVRNLLLGVGLTYPEHCLLTVLRRK
jgi:hypothetical protein